MLVRMLSEIGLMEIHVIYLVKPSPEVTWEADHVSIRQASLEGEEGKLKFNFLFAIICCDWQYYKTSNTSGKKMGTFKQKLSG